MLKRIVSFILSIAMVFTMVPAQAFAVEMVPEVTDSITAPVEANTEAPSEEKEETTAVPTEVTVEVTSAPVQETTAPAETEVQTQDTTLTTEAVPTEPTVEETEASEAMAPTEETVPEETTECTEETIPEINQEAVGATSGTCGDDLTWELSDDGVLTISGNGGMSSYSTPSSVPWYSYLGQVLSVVIEEGVTSIGDGAFGGCIALSEVIIPDSVCSVGSYAFKDCDSLTKVALGSGVHALFGYAFYDCDGLVSVYIPPSVERIYTAGWSGGPFYGCSSDLKIYCKLKNEEWDDCWNSNGANWLAVYTGYTRADYDFWSAVDKSSASIVIPEGLTIIHNDELRGCTSVTDITIPSSITSIGHNAFDGCTALTDITIPSSVTSIGSYAFYGCTALTEVTIPSGITSIGYNAFGGCTDLTRLNITDLKAWCGIDFSDSYANPMYYTGGAYVNGQKLTRLTIPSGVTKVEDYAFCGCGGLTSVTIPSSVTSIGGSAFYGCDGLTSVTIPSSVTSIGSSAFYGCDGLTSVTIPSGVTSIGSGAFESCDNLAAVTIPASVTSVGSDAFDDCASSLTIRYGGTMRQWVEVSDTNYKAVCSDGSIFGWGWCGNDAKWILDNSYTLKVIGSGNMDSVYYGNTPWEDYKDYIAKVVVEEGITSVASYSFMDCSNLTTVTLPETIEEIGSNAFSGNENLTSINIPDSVTYIGSYAFSWCPKAEGIRLPACVTYIGSGAFSGCDTLISVVIPEGVTTIKSGTFQDCENLTTVTLTGSITAIEEYAFQYCGFSNIVLPEGLTTIGKYAFAGCNKLTSITIPRSVEVISSNAFYSSWDTKLNTIIFRHGPNDSLLIGTEAFYAGKTTVTSVKVPVKSETHAAISGYDWTGSNRTVTYSSHNCMNDHYEVVEGGTPATCTESGVAGRIYCAACGKTISENTTIPALGHIRVEDKGCAATCTSAGLTDGSHCERCNATLVAQQTIAALGHSTKTIPAVAPTCTSSGLTAGSQCTRCSVILTEQETVAALGHNLVAVPAVEPTCTATGLTEGEKCSRCGYVSVAQNTVAKLAHTSVYKNAVAPTCTKTGLTEGYACSVCNTTISGRRTVAALGHTKVPIGERVEPTCSSTGLTEGVKCSVCGETLTARATIAMLPHTFDSNSECTVCGEVDLIGYGSCGNKVEWQLRTNGLLTISGSGAMYNYASYSKAPWYSDRSRITTVTVESGVTSIGDYAFYDCDSLISVTMADTVTSIGTYAFYDCDAIPSVTGAAVTYNLRATATGVVIPASVTSIGSNAFANCDSLTAATLPEGVTTIGMYAFKNCANLTEVSLPESLTTIGSYAFADCNRLAAVTLPDGLTAIPTGLFYNSDALTEVTIPEGVTGIGEYAFYDCDGLTAVTIPGSVETIGNSAFKDCDSLTEVTVSEGVTTIGDSAFSGCGNLTSITIPESVTKIGKDAFAGCDDTNIDYAGTLDQWLEVTGGSYKAYGTCGESAYWTLTEEGVLTILGTGPMADYSDSDDNRAPWYNYRDSITSLVVEEGVTGIGAYAFHNCTGLTEATIPDSVTGIGKAAFKNCYRLATVYISNLAAWCMIEFSSLGNPMGEAEHLVLNGQEITELVIPEGITEIKDCAFYSCENITAVTIPDSVTSIGGYAFYGCSSLSTVNISDLAAWCVIEFGSSGNPMEDAEHLVLNGQEIIELVIPEEITEIKYYAFYGCENITAVTIPAGVTSIGDCSFSGCSSLTEVDIPESVTNIGSVAFYRCSNLTKVTIPEGVTSIDYAVFADCSSLTKVDIPESVTSIGSAAFKNCSSLFSIAIPEGVTSIGEYAFSGCSRLHGITIPEGVTTISNYTFLDCSSFSRITIPEGVIRIGNYAFSGCRGMYSITIPESVTSIDDYAFENCSNLFSITIPEGVTSIGSCAFSLCDSLDSITIPESVTHIGNHAFSISGLRTVDLPKRITVIEEGTFANCEDLRSITIPASVASIGDSAFHYCDELERLTFLGSAPAFGNNVFNRVAAEVYYPAGDSTWTDSVKQNYGGTITWVPVYASSLEILNEDGQNVAGTTYWLDLNAGMESCSFSASVLPLGAYGAFTWSWTDSSATVVENEDGTVTVTSNGNPCQLTLTATALDGSNTSSSVTIKFVSLAVEKEEIPGEDPADMNLLSGKNKALKIYDADTGKALTNKQVRWSMDEAYAPYAKIDKNGKLTAKKVVEKVRVEAVATIIGSESTTVTVTIDIFPAVSSVELLDGEEMVNNKTISLDSGAEPLVLTANIHPLDAMDGVTWSISDKKEAFATYEISENVLTVTPKADAKAGAVTIKVTSNDGSKKTATVKLQFAAYAKTVTIDKSITTLTAGDKAVQLNATMTPDVVTKAGIVWSLKNPTDKNYVNLSSAGKITPKAVLAPVDVTVVATSKDGMAKDEHTIRVLPKSQAQLVLMDEKGNYVTKTTQTLDVNTQESITLSAFTYGETEMTTVEWSPLTAKGAEITANEDGSLTIRMLAAGSVNVTAKAEDGRKATVTIKGVKLAQALEISQKKTNITEGLEVASGKSVDLQVTLTNAANKKAVWSIEEGGAYATIASSGKFTAAKDLTTSHKVVVRATAADGSGIYDEMEIMVRPIAQGVQVYSEAGGRMLFSFRTSKWWVRSNTTLTWDLSTQENTIAMDARVYPYYGEDNARNAMQKVSWKSSAPKVADFVDGQLVIYKTGSTTITVMAEDGSKQKVTVKLNVVKTVTELKIDDQSVASGKSLNLAKFITINPTDATNKKLTWTITKGGEYATISNNGAFKAKKVTASKRVEVTVSSQDGGASATFYVTITP